jgi:hypothetical protein
MSRHACLWVVLVLAAVLSTARADVAPPKRDTCYHEAEGATCKPLVGPPGHCEWVTSAQRNDMELHAAPRCKGTGASAYPCLMCVSDVFAGDLAAQRKRVATLIDARDFDGAEILLQYLANVGQCDPQLGQQWLRLVKARARDRDLHALNMARHCDPSIPK